MTIDDTNIESLLNDELTPRNGNESSNTNGDGGEGAPAGTGGASEQTYTLPDGRQVKGEDVLEEYKKLQADYTKKTQKLSDLEKAITGNQSQGKEGEDGNELSADDQEVARIIDRVLPHTAVGKKIAYKDDLTVVTSQASNQTLARIELNKALTELEADYNGSMDESLGVSKPKVTADEVASYIRSEFEKGNRLSLSPVQIARILHPKEFALYDAAGYGRGVQRTQLPETEKGGNSGGGNSNPPSPKFDFGNDSVEKGLAEILK